MVDNAEYNAKVAFLFDISMTSNTTPKSIAILLLFVGMLLPAAQTQTSRARLVTIAPVSAPQLVLELSPDGIKERFTPHTAIPTNTANQKWLCIEDGVDTYIIRSAWDKELVLSVIDPNIRCGTKVTMAIDHARAGQRWSLTHINGDIFFIAPRCTPNFVIDNFGGNKSPHTQPDLWTFNRNDNHLMWLLKTAIP